MFARLSSHDRAVVQAIFITFLWSTSWVLIKLGLRESVPPVLFAGLRYAVAALCLLPLLLRRRDQLAALRRLSARQWLNLAVLGALFYAITQGAQYVGLALLPAATVNLLLSFSVVVVALLGILLLGEHPTRAQGFGVTLFIIGVLVYFIPVALPAEQGLGLLVVLGGVAANAASTVLARAINRGEHLSPLAITTVSMGIGAALLLGAGFATSTLPPLSLTTWAIIVWLAVVNTAFAFTLWNHTMRTLAAMESSAINNLMLIFIPVLAFVFLGEGISLKSGIGFALAVLGIFAVQARRRPSLTAALPTTLANKIPQNNRVSPGHGDTGE